MKLQLALDRITLEQALAIAQSASENADVIEVGTSLIKDYGMESVRRMKGAFPQKGILADIKTMDEGAYEFRATYQAGADIATVMAAASIDTITACYQVAEELSKTMMIDLLEIGMERIPALLPFHHAIFCVHAPVDQKDKNLVGHLLELKKQFPEIKHLAIAGGIQLGAIQELQSLDIDMVIVGSAITKSEQPEQVSKEFYNAIHRSI